MTAAIGVLALTATLMVPTTLTQAAPLPADFAPARLQPAETRPYGMPTTLQPDIAYSTPGGGRVEVYTSAGDNDGTPDWRSVNAFAYLVNNVPAQKHLYATVFNSLYDYGSARELPTGKFELRGQDGKVLAPESTFGPSLAFLNQINNYPNKTEAQKFIHVLGARRSMGEAYDAPSTLARLLSTSAGAGVMKYCSAKKASGGNPATGTSTGACLTTNVDDALMHSKYALFEQTKDSTGALRDNVVWVTSANLNGSSGGKKSNTSVAIYGDAAAYSGLVDVFNAEITQTFTDAFKSAQKNGVAGTSADFKFYPSPRTIDFEALALQAAADVPNKTECKATLAHSLFNSARDGIFPALSELQGDGCDVRILLGENAISDVVDSYFGMSNKAREVIKRVEFGNVHDKAITVSYTAGGNPQGFTFGGSANANGTSLTHDELAFRADDLRVTRAVEQHLDRLYQLIRGGKAVTQVTSLSVKPAVVAINQDSTLKLAASVTPSDASVKTVSWTSSDRAVVEVDQSGQLTAKRPGVATITATSLSGNRTATVDVTVNNDLDETPAPTPTKVQIDTPPTLSVDEYQTLLGDDADDKTTEFVITWGSGNTDVSGTVALQYYDGGWKTKATVPVNNGRAVKSLTLKSSRAWRAKATSITSPAGATLGDAAQVSAGYVYNVVKTRAATATPRIYAPTMVRNGDLAPFLVSGTKLSGNLRLQYLTSKGWKTKLTFTKSGGTQKFVSTPVGNTRKWRVATSTSRSTSVTVKVIG